MNDYKGNISLYIAFPSLYGYEASDRFVPANIVYYPIDDGAVLTSTFNETLDTAIVYLSNIPDSVYQVLKELVVYDVAILYSSTDGVNFTKVKRMLIDTISIEQIKMSSPYYRNIKLELFSETKILEKVILPNYSITTTKSNGQSNSRTTGYYINQLLQEYCPRIRVQNVASATLKTRSFEPIISVDPDMMNLFNVPCPDMQWNKPTLREAITDLMLTQNCIPLVTDGALGYFDLTKKGNDISTTALSDGSGVQLDRVFKSVQSQDSSEYCNEMNLTVTNVTNNEQEGVDNLVNSCEYIGYRNSDEYVLTTNNLRLNTQFPIYSNPKVTMCWTAHYKTNLSNSKVVYSEMDISRIITEKKTHSVLPLINTLSLTNIINNLLDMGKYQNTSFFYERGTNYIQGFEQSGKIAGMIPYEVAKILFREVSYEQENNFISDTEYIVEPTYEDTDYDIINNVFFKVEYQTLSSVKARVGKYLQPKRFIESADNQSSSYSDSQRLGSYEYFKENRLGNKAELLNARFDTLADVPTIGQTYNDEVIYEVSTIYQNHFFLVEMSMTKNFVLADYYTGVRSKIRSWKIAEDTEALERNDLFKLYGEFSKQQKNDFISQITTVSEQTTYTYSRYMGQWQMDFDVSYLCYPLNKATTIIPSTINNCLYQAFSNYAFTSYYPVDTSSSFLMDTQPVIFGNSIVTSFGTADNYSAGRFISNYFLVSSVGGWSQQDLQYTDSVFGENYGGVARFFGTLAPTTDYQWPAVLSEPSISSDTLANTSRAKPLTKASSTLTGDIKLQWFMPKDNRDITKITSQIEFCSDTKDIVFGKEWIKRQQPVSLFTYFDSTQQPYGILTTNIVYQDLTELTSKVSPFNRTGQYAVCGNNSVAVVVYDQGGLGYYYKSIKLDLSNTFFEFQGSYYYFKNYRFVKVSRINFLIKLFTSEIFNSDNGEPSISGYTPYVTLGTNYLETTVINENTEEISAIIPPFSQSIKSVAIVDENNNVILGWNGVTKSHRNSIYLNVKGSRDDFVYDDTTGDTKIATIAV